MEIKTQIDGVDVVFESDGMTAEEVKKWDGKDELIIRYRSWRGNEKVEGCSLEWDERYQRAILEWDSVRPEETGYPVSMMTLKPENILSIRQGPDVVVW